MSISPSNPQHRTDGQEPAASAAGGASLVGWFWSYVQVNRPDDLNIGASTSLRNFVRFLWLLVTSTLASQLPRRASSLTYTTILSLFPLLVLLLAISSIFLTAEREDKFIGFLQERLYPSAQLANIPGQQTKQAEMEKNAEDLSRFIKDSTAKFRKSAAGIGLVGFIAMLVAAGLLYNAIEDAFNTTWTGGRPRQLKRTATTFMAILVLAPMVIGISVAVTTVAELLLGVERVESAVVQVENPPAQSPTPAVTDDASTTTTAASVETKSRDGGSAPEWLRRFHNSPLGEVLLGFGFLLTFLPALLNGLFLTTAYVVIPHTRVSFKSALIGGMTAGILWELMKAGFLNYVFSSTLNRELFRSLGAVPIFLIWIYFTWLVLLLGNEIAYCHTHFRRLCLNAFFARGKSSIDGKMVIAAMILAAESFDRGQRSIRIEEMWSRLGLEQTELLELVDRLEKAGFLQQTAQECYTLGRPADRIALRDLLLMGCDTTKLPGAHDVGEDSAIGRLARLQDELLTHVGERTLSELVRGDASFGMRPSETKA